jgi:DNA-binding beta-propeller fold protein YncE
MQHIDAFGFGLAIAAAVTAAEGATPPPATAPPSTGQAYTVSAVALPGAPTGGVLLDFLAVDRGRERVWIPAGGTGSVVVIEAKSGQVHSVPGFATAEIERRGVKRTVGPSSASLGDGVMYVGSRGDSSVCAVDAATLAKAGCVTLPGSPDGVAYVARTKEVWVTTPRDQSIVILDVSSPGAPKIAGSFKLEGDPEGYAVDDARGVFYTNLEDKDRTLRIDLTTRKVTATWNPACGEDGPRGLALDPAGRFLMTACTDHVEVLDAGRDGRILSKLDTGEGVDNLDYLPATRSLYAAAGRAGTLTVARLDAKGGLVLTATVTTSKGARNAVAVEDGTAYMGDGPEGKVVIARPARHGG